ncbi:MAG: hypothetical protein ACRYG8_19440, partial [Janthinobacterium lividum]
MMAAQANRGLQWCRTQTPLFCFGGWLAARRIDHTGRQKTASVHRASICATAGDVRENVGVC